jgi:hypothetical protein
MTGTSTADRNHFEDLEAVDVRKAQVEQHDVRLLVNDRVQPREAGRLAGNGRRRLRARRATSGFGVRPDAAARGACGRAVALHEGPFDDLDRTYGALGSYVAEREVAVDVPIREYYLNASDRGPDDDVQPRIEVGWPIFRTA